MQSPLNYLTTEDYLENEKQSNVRHEYVDGQIFAMTGSSREHNLIATNIIALLRPHLRGSSCRGFVSDMKVKINRNNQRADFFYYPDIVVTCNSQDRERFFLTVPCLIIEILSPSTQATDKREKRINYQSLESLQEYVLIAQDEFRLEVYRRDDSNIWQMETLGQQDSLQLSSVGLTLTMAEIYEDVLNFF